LFQALRGRSTTILEIVVAILPALIGLAEVARLGPLRAQKSAPTVLSTWGFVLVLSFIGWGAAVNELASPKRRLDFGLRAALGAAAAQFLGGLMALFGLVSKTTFLGTAVLGLASLGIFEFRRRREVMRAWTNTARLAREAPLFAALLALLAGAAVVQCLAFSTHSGGANPHDDDLAYFEFARQLLGSGTLIEPFSLRRMQSLGGQAYLHATGLVFCGIDQLNFIDCGLFMVLACALAIGVLARRPREGRLGVALAVMLIISLPNTRINSTSEMTGAVFFLALYRLLAGGHARPSAGWRGALLVGLVGAAASSLRQNYIAGVALVVILTMCARLASATKEQRPRVLVHALVVAGLSLAAIFPWLALAYRSNGTFLFPLMKGGFNPAFSFLGKAGGKIVQAQLFVKCFFYEAPVSTFGFFVLAGAVAVDRRAGRPLLAYVAGIVLAGIALVYTFELSDKENLARYFYSLEVALVVGVLLDVAGRTSGRPVARGSMNYPALVCVIATVTCLLGLKPGVATSYDRWLEALNKFDDPPTPGPPPEEQEPHYIALQQSVPAGQRLMVMLDAPYRLDFKRNRIVNLDLPGAASPSSAMPLLDGPEAFASYLLDRAKIRYIAFVKEPAGFDLYQSGLWQNHLKNANPTGSELMYQNWARYFLATFSDLAELAKTRKHLYDGRGDIVVLDLATRSS
jgi:hypothetical protein